MPKWGGQGGRARQHPHHITITVRQHFFANSPFWRHPVSALSQSHALRHISVITVRRHFFPVVPKLSKMCRKMKKNKRSSRTPQSSLYRLRLENEIYKICWIFCRFRHTNIHIYIPRYTFYKQKPVTTYRQHFYDLCQHNVSFLINVLSIRVLFS